MKKVVWSLIVVGALISAVPAQGLADLARRKKGDEKPAGKVITNRDLETPVPVGESAGQYPMTTEVRQQISLLNDRNATVRGRALQALQRMGPAAAAAVPFVARLAGDRTQMMYLGGRHQFLLAELAIQTLGSIGKPAVTSLINLFSSVRSPTLQTQIVTMLGKIGDTRALPLLERLAQDPAWKQKVQWSLESVRGQDADGDVGN